MAKKFSLTKRRQEWAAHRREAPVFEGSILNPPAALQVKYANSILKLVKEMIDATEREITQLFESETGSAYFAMDASISSQSRIALNSLESRFGKLFGEQARTLSENMMRAAGKASAKSLHSSLQTLSGGMSIKTAVGSAPLKEIVKAGVSSNVNLIKSIEAKYLPQVKQAVMKSITNGQGLKDLVPALQKYKGQTERSAKNMAMDQTRKAYSNIAAARMQAIGIKKFMWHHSGGSAHPREDHVEMDGNVYEFANPPVIDRKTGERGLPGDAYNCHCTMSPVFEYDEATK